MKRLTSLVSILSLTLYSTLPLVAQSPTEPIGVSGQTATSTPSNSSASVTAKPNTLVDGTPVKLRIGRNVSSADAKVGEHVDFEVLEEVQVQGVVVIAKGATASATVTDAQSKRRMGRGGKLDINLDFVRLIDNEKAALTATAGGKGGGHTGAMVGAMAATAIFTLGGSALFLLMHGKDITVPKGSETTAYINGDMPLDIAKFSPQTAPVLAITPVTSGLSQVSVEASVANCDIEVDGAFAGNTPSQLSLTAGKHDISITKKGYSNWTRTITIAGPEIHLHADLDALAGS